MTASLKAALVVLALVTLAACERQPDEVATRAAVTERLVNAFAEPTFALAEFRRLGSGPLTAEAGRARRIVYFRATLEATRAWNVAAWDGLNLAALAQLLGATEAGIRGLGPTGAQPGDRLVVSGTVTFLATERGWMPVAFVPPPVASPPASLSPAARETQALVERLDALLANAGSVPAALRRAIARTELDRAISTIELRLRRLMDATVVAGGPAGGAYEEVAGLLASSLSAPGKSVAAVPTAGSVENARLVQAKTVELALVQSNVARLALDGAPPFEGEAPFGELRALASLFPEAVQVVVLDDGPIRTLGDLRGRRAAVGRPGSGSRLDALAVLNAAGLRPDELAALVDTDPLGAAQALAAGRVDALIVTAMAPSRPVQVLATERPLRILPIEGPIASSLADAGFVALRLPPQTYPNQTAEIRTVAVSALLVARDDLPDPVVEAALAALFERIDWVAARSMPGSLIGLATARRGLSLPLHPAAERWLNAKKPPSD